MYDYWVDDETGGTRTTNERAFCPSWTCRATRVSRWNWRFRSVARKRNAATWSAAGGECARPTRLSPTLQDYQRYIQSSRGEFSCAKPSCVRLQNAWVSDRTLCYLASGKPAVVQHTGASRFLPDAAGLFRFSTLDEAAKQLEIVAADYDRQCQLGRALAEEYFDARKVAAQLLEQALD